MRRNFKKIEDNLLVRRMREVLSKHLKKVFLGGGCAKEFLKIRRKSSWEEDARRRFLKLQESIIGRRMREGFFKD